MAASDNGDLLISKRKGQENYSRLLLSRKCRVPKQLLSDACRMCTGTERNFVRLYSWAARMLHSGTTPS